MRIFLTSLIPLLFGNAVRRWDEMSFWLQTSDSDSTTQDREEKRKRKGSLPALL
jgi:hypothetical protein